jgi:hypothetical protein
MAAIAWGAVPWISVTVASLLERALSNERGPLAPGRLAQVRNSLLRASVHGRAGILPGVLVLMKFKPDRVGSVSVMAVALALALLAVVPMLARQPAAGELVREGA